MQVIDGFVLGVLGGIITEIYGVYQLRKRTKAQRPDWISSRFYWLSTAPMVMLGGGIVVLYMKTGVPVNEWLAVHLGIATPALVGTLTKNAPSVEPG